MIAMICLDLGSDVEGDPAIRDIARELEHKIQGLVLSSKERDRLIPWAVVVRGVTGINIQANCARFSQPPFSAGVWTLSQIAAQLEAREYQCEDGSLRTDAAFMALREWAAAESLPEEARDAPRDSPRADDH